MSNLAKPASGYFTTAELTARYKVSRMTLLRWINREENPLPPPKIKAAGGSQNRWSIDDVIEWENGVAG